MHESEKYKYQLVSFATMNKQVNVRLPKTLHLAAKKYAASNGFSSIQELMKETLREKLHPELTKEEIILVKKLIEISDKHNLYGTEKELFAALGKR